MAETKITWKSVVSALFQGIVAALAALGVSSCASF